MTHKAKNSLHERRIEVNHISLRGIHFMVHDDECNPCHVIFDAEDARELAKELLDAADELDILCRYRGDSTDEQ
jgi:hypothetical protein